jgi:hypothetical protein
MLSALPTAPAARPARAGGRVAGKSKKQLLV